MGRGEARINPDVGLKLEVSAFTQGIDRHKDEVEIIDIYLCWKEREREREA